MWPEDEVGCGFALRLGPLRRLPATGRAHFTVTVIKVYIHSMAVRPPPELDFHTLQQAGGECACFNLRKAARTVTQLYDAALKPAGVLATQLPLLAATATLERATVTELAEAMVMDRTTLTRNLRPLERDGLVRTTPGKDRRVREVSLTRKGQKVVLEAYPLWRQAQATVARRLGAKRVKYLVAELTAAVEALRG